MLFHLRPILSLSSPLVKCYNYKVTYWLSASRFRLFSSDDKKDERAATEMLSQLNEDQKHLIYHMLHTEKLLEKYEESLGSPIKPKWKKDPAPNVCLSKFGRPCSKSMEDLTSKVLCEVSSTKLRTRLEEKIQKSNLPISFHALRTLFIINALPFIGFGFFDNFIMVLAGDYIDVTLGFALGISTMAAAALGNTISNLLAISTTWYIEDMAVKIGMKEPSLTTLQMETSQARWASNFGRAFGVTFGCLLGMVPLFFLSQNKEKAEERRNKRQKG